jgi:5-methylcytosine-specific restriction endonuclease McrA
MPPRPETGELVARRRTDQRRKFERENLKRKLADPEFKARHRKRIAAKTQRYKARHPAAVSVSRGRRRARLKQGEGLTPAEWQATLEEYGGRCAYCARIRKLTLDHIEPLCKGGKHEAGNAAPACAECNGTKNGRQLIIWLALRAA